MKRNMKRPALAAALAAFLLCPMHAETRIAFAAQQAAQEYMQTAGAAKAVSNLNWKDDGGHYQVTTQTDPLNMRAEPDPSAMIITTIPKGAVVTVLQTAEGWGKVQYGSVIGYCVMNWLTPAPETVPASENNAEENEKIIYQYLTQTLGLTSAAACGIIGNIHVETGGTFDPEAHNPEDVGDTQGYGICQWNSGADAGYRMEELQNYSPEWKTLACQLDFIRYDLLHNSYLISLQLYDKLKAIGNTEEDAAEASDLWAKCYEGCAQWTYEMRREKARLYYSEHCGKSLQWEETKRICYVATESGDLNMRSAPSLFGSILTTIPKDTEVTVKSVSDDGKWGEVVYKDKTGYCAMEYLKDVASKPVNADNALRGDVNGNAEIGADDAQITLVAYAERIAGKNMNLTDAQIKAADIDEDGLVSVEDAQWILKYYTEKYVSGMDITWEDLFGKSVHSSSTSLL